MTTTLLRGGRIVLADKTITGDLLIEDGKISQISESISTKADTTIELEGKLVMAGAIDTHVHFREPGITHKGDAATESAAAVAGGVTTVCDMPNTVPQATTIEEVKNKQKLFASKCLTNFGLYIGASKNNLEELKRADDDNTIPAIKIFMAESTGEMTLSEMKYLDPIFEQTNKLIAVHAEDEIRRKERVEMAANGEIAELKGLDPESAYQHAIIRDNLCAALGTKTAMELAVKHSHKTHILHMSTEEELEYFQTGVDAGVLTGETCPHYIMFNREDLIWSQNLRKMNPALKQHKDNLAMVKALESGLITQLTTDHAPHTFEEKLQNYTDAPAGLPCIQFLVPFALHLAKTYGWSHQKVTELLSGNAAKNYGIQNKGQIKEGYDADLAIIDTDCSLYVTNEDVVSLCGWTPFAGSVFTGGSVDMTFVNGNLVFNQGEINTEPKGKNIEVR